MLDVDNKQLDNLNIIQETIHDIDCAIFMRKNSELCEKVLKNFENIVDNTYMKYNLKEDEFLEDKKVILDKYKTILKEFIDVIESLFAYALEKIEDCEINKNTVLFKIIILSSSKQNEKSKNELNLTDIEIQEKTQKLKKKIIKYNKLINFCEREFEMARNTIDLEIEIFDFKDINFKSNGKGILYFDKNKKIKSEILNYFNTYLDDFYDNTIKNKIKNVKIYTYIFDKTVDKLHKKILDS